MASSPSSRPSASIAMPQAPAITMPIATPTHGPHGHHSIACSTTIHAPLGVVLAALVDTRSYASWNGFCPRATVHSQPLEAAPTTTTTQLDPALAALATTLRVGTVFTFDVHLRAGPPRRSTTTTLCVSALEDFSAPDGRTGVRLAWKTAGGWRQFGALLRSERVQELVEVRRHEAQGEGEGDGDGVTAGPLVEYRCWETFYGLLAGVVRAVVGRDLQHGFGSWMDGLREHAQQQHEAAVERTGVAHGA